MSECGFPWECRRVREVSKSLREEGCELVNFWECWEKEVRPNFSECRLDFLKIQIGKCMIGLDESQCKEWERNSQTLSRTRIIMSIFKKSLILENGCLEVFVNVV